MVNVGRGAVIDEAALFSALSDRQIQAAGLDVWYHYPKDDAARAQTMAIAAIHFMSWKM